MPQQVPRSASEYARAQRAEQGAAVAAATRIWRRQMRADDLDGSYDKLEPQLLETVYTAQGRVAETAQRAIPVMAADNGVRVRERDLEPYPETWAGTTGDGREVHSLLHESVTRTKTDIGRGFSPPTALTRAGSWLALAVGTLLSDTKRGMEQLESYSRHITTYVRVLNPPSCGRCVILAGRSYKVDAGFARHPGCDCYSMPVIATTASQRIADPDEYLGSLSDEELADALGSKANAEAYREYGADVNQLVNAYRRSGDVRIAQVYGRNVRYTTEGTTKRGMAYRSMSQADYVRAQATRRNGRYARLRAPRLMPSSILQIAENRADAERLLKLYGWVL